MDFFSRRAAFFLATTATFLLAGCGTDPPVVWPVSGEGTNDFPLSSTYGPRVHTDGLVYDFHRGIDIATPSGTDIHAIAAGKVVQIEATTSAGGMLVQLEHQDGYFSNYIHCSEIDVDVGDTVEPGDVIAKSGKSTNGFEHLHFEIRRPTDSKRDCVHPLDVLPYVDNGAPSLEITKVDTTNPIAPSVTVKVDVPANELDLRRVSVETFEADDAAPLDALKALSEQVYDYEEWNHSFTQTDSDVLVDDPDLEGILVRPQKYNATMGTFSLEFTFTKLVGPATSGMLRARAEVIDVRGNVLAVESPTPK
jgi:murein DD-endopeptidase MepM/ murein hydrolase activator NlpD